jgi:hypothetical protein
MKRSLTWAAALFAVMAFSSEARSQWQDGNLAIKTNGTTFQSGDQLKVEIIALNAVNELFYTQVSYKFTETVKVREKDKDSKEEKEVTRQEERTRTRPAGPVLESMEKYRTLVLDDTFHFGEGNPTGRYTIEVNVFRAYGKERLATLRAYIFFQNVDYACKACAPFLGSLKRANSAQWLAFDGIFAESGRYTVLLLSNGQVVKHIIASIYSSGSRELNIISDQLTGTSGRTFDILIQDHDRQVSSTLARVNIPSAP